MKMSANFRVLGGVYWKMDLVRESLHSTRGSSHAMLSVKYARFA